MTPPGRLAVIGGHSILGIDLAAGMRPRSFGGGAAPVTVLDAGDHVVLQRHGLERYTPAHRIDHARNLRALLDAGCTHVLALSSVGALRADLPVGTFVAPHDFMALDQPPLSVFADARAHVVPGFSAAWRGQVVAAWGRAAEPPLRDGGVYWQSNGPRFETPAEVRFIAGFADVVGMTIGSECVAAGELELEYAAVCVVDNLANGLGPRPLTMAEFEAGKAANLRRLLPALAAVVGELVA